MKALRELEDIRRDRWLESQLPGLREEARRLGVPDPDRADGWALLGAVNAAHDERRRPELEERARRLGVWTHRTVGFWRWRKAIPRDVTQLALAVYDEERRRQLSRELGL